MDAQFLVKLKTALSRKRLSVWDFIHQIKKRNRVFRQLKRYGNWVNIFKLVAKSYFFNNFLKCWVFNWFCFLHLLYFSVVFDSAVKDIFKVDWIYVILFQVTFVLLLISSKRVYQFVVILIKCVLINSICSKIVTGTICKLIEKIILRTTFKRLFTHCLKPIEVASSFGLHGEHGLAFPWALPLHVDENFCQVWWSCGARINSLLNCEWFKPGFNLIRKVKTYHS